MKRILAVLCILMLLVSGCGKAVPSEGKMFKEITGEYLRADDLKEFRRTKSAVDSFSDICAMAIRKDGGKYTVLIGNGHQGVSLGTIETVSQNEAGNYAFEAKADENNNVKGEFSPGEKQLNAVINTDFVNRKKDMSDYYMWFENDVAQRAYLSQLLFDGIEGIKEEEGKYVAEIDGKKYELAVTYDVADIMDTQKFDGSIYADVSGEKERMFFYYAYENGKITLFDSETEKKVAEFR